MIEAAEGVGMNAEGCAASTGPCAARKSAGVIEIGVVETRRSVIEMTVIAKGSVVIDESRTDLSNPCSESPIVSDESSIMLQSPVDRPRV
jgi:hypothetical protein